MMSKKTHLGPPPGLLDLVIPVALVTNELLRPLLDDLRPGGRCDSHLLLLKLVNRFQAFVWLSKTMRCSQGCYSNARECERNMMV